jgi:hypothetical protein
MANDNQDTLSTGVLFLGGGVAGYAVGRWIVARWFHNKGAQTATPASMVASPPALPPATSPLPSSPGAPTPPPAPAQLEPPKITPRPQPSGPVTSPSQVESGPITSPSQVDGPPPGARPIDPYGPPPGARPIDPYTNAIATPPNGLSRRFDPIFERYRGATPIEYLRALAERESGMNPNARGHAARGLMQIVPVALTDYNTRHGTQYLPEHLFDPTINVAIGCELLRMIIASYHRHHPRVRNLQADWDNLRFVELLTFGWNAGFSEAGGVGRVARYLEQRGITELTVDLVARAAQTAGASKHLADPTRLRWCKSVAALYDRERTRSRLSTS